MYSWKKDIAQWSVGKTLYLSVVFTWQLPEAEQIAKQHKGKVIAGGPAIILAKKERFFDLSWAETPDNVPYDTLAFHNPCATYTSRGCPNKCSFCAVPKIEGGLVELETWKPAPVICDNNITACSEKHFKQVIDSLLPFPMVDFNQGLDAKLFTPFHAWELSRLKSVKIRFAYDNLNCLNVVKLAVDLCREVGLVDIGIYCLIGYNDTPETAKERLDTIGSWGIKPNPMRYQPLNTIEKNNYVDVGNGWTKKELGNMMRYYSRLNWLGHIEYKDYRQGYHKEQRSIFQLFSA